MYKPVVISRLVANVKACEQCPPPVPSAPRVVVGTCGVSRDSGGCGLGRKKQAGLQTIRVFDKPL